MIFEYSTTEKIYYNVIGAGKTPILFLHGFCASHLTWDYIIDSFDKERYTLILVDLLGHGNSSIHENSDYSLTSQTKIIFELIDFLKLGDFIIVGHSYGGSVALLLTILYEKELTLRKLILIDAGAYPDEIPFFIRHLKNPLISFFASKGSPLIPKSTAGFAVLKSLYFNKKLVNKNRVSKYSKFFSPEQFKAIIKAAKKIIPDDFDSIVKQYSKIEIPVLIIWGKNDSVISSASGKKLNSSLSNSKLKIVTNCGHIPQEEKPEETFQLIRDFLH